MTDIVERLKWLLEGPPITVLPFAEQLHCLVYQDAARDRDWYKRSFGGDLGA